MTMENSAQDSEVEKHKAHTPPAPLADKFALVTGASRGIGKAIAQELALAGAYVGLLDLKQDWAKRAADDIIAQGGKAIGFEADVSDRESIGRVFSDFAASTGRLDILVNNAMWNRYEPLEEINPESFSKMTAVGLGGIVWGIQAAVPHMTAGGSIINMGSMAGRLGSSNSIVYSMVKAGVDGLTRSASVELGGRNIRVNAIAPGTIMTEGVSAMMTEDRVAARTRQTPMGRLGQVSDIAQTALWLADDRSAFITGQSIAVDGGLGHNLNR
jgi:NAD(P)-dependent dehydrogenase (short-subunit alcohol dehydrogenase family)